ncbi:hypothetical protein KO481_32860 [Nocardia sp. NEAU-G5]|uniref:Secreted protein n=1 Tax=Nocardia albiluteola TaxID=2842303 RepID=A0ABS6B7K8_9NOCA|nr:hypothetical protein [Nocardia albiluteola]MBU3066297.1 hypothetical protein [Nocardia albiluteola]
MTRTTRRSAALLLGVLATLSVSAATLAGGATADPAPSTPPVPPNLHCHTPWQLPVYTGGQWRCAGGPGPVVLPHRPFSHN